MGTCEIQGLVDFVHFLIQAPTTYSMVILCKSLVLCHLDYCGQLWSPSNIGSIQSLKLPQKAFVTRTEGMSCLNYWEELDALRLQSPSVLPFESSEGAHICGGGSSYCSRQYLSLEVPQIVGLGSSHCWRR